MSPERFVDVTSTTAAKIFNLYPKKGKFCLSLSALFMSKLQLLGGKYDVQFLYRHQHFF